jgi:hypothetical protein
MENIFNFESPMKHYVKIFQTCGNYYSPNVGEHGGWENTFNFIFHEVQLQNGLNENLPMVVSMYFQTFFTLNFSYDATFEKWQKMKSKRIEVLDLLESV